MRLVLFFDLPTETSKNRRDYRAFRKKLIKAGFIMLQESVYSKLVINRASLDLIKKRISGICPDEGSVMCLTVTEKQFDMMDIFAGGVDMRVVDTTDELVVL